DRIVVFVDRVESPDHTRADAADVEAAHLAFAEEEPVGQLDIVLPWPAILQSLDIAAFRGEREYPSRRERPVLGGGPDDTRIARRAAESGEIEAYRRGFAARRADAVVERVVDQRQAEHRAGA